MLIKRIDAFKVLEVIENLKDQKFDFQTQYKLLKIKRSILEDEEILKEQIQENCSEFFEEGPHNLGEYNIKKDCIEQCQEKINQLYSINISIPDIYFTEDELKNLSLTLSQLESLMCFIK